MIFGNPMGFAIEFELEKEYGGIWLFGKFCYRVKNQCIGEYSLGTSLRDIFLVMGALIRTDRTHNYLYSLSAEDLYNRLNDVLYGFEKSPYDDIADEEQWARFNVTLPVDIFDGWKIFLIEGSEKARMIIGKDDTDIYEVPLHPDEFNDVITDVYNELGKLYEAENAA